MKKFIYLSSENITKGTFYATDIQQKDEVVGVFSGLDLVGVVRLAPGENISLIVESFSIKNYG